MAEERVVVEVDLRVERDDAVVAGHDERVHLEERAVALVEALVESLEELARLRHERRGHADAPRDLVGVLVGEAGEGIDRALVDLLGSLRGDFLDVHAALARCHQHRALHAAIDDERDVELLADVGAFLDEEPAHEASLWARLVRDQRHAEHLRGEIAHLVHRARELHAAALAAAAGVDLRLHDPDFPAQLLRRFHGLVDRERGKAPRGRHAVFAKEFLALVFVDVHGVGGARPAGLAAIRRKSEF